LKVAVIGSGITGLSAAWLLSQSCRVTLFEKNARFGGHSNTVDVDDDGRRVPIDTGFIVYNTASYPNLIALFDHLGVATAPTEMSFSVSLDDGRFEYSGNGLSGLFGQPSNLLSRRHWLMSRDILRFFKQASFLDADTHDPDETLGEFLAKHRYSRGFIRGHILPMAAAIWSTPADQILAFPVAAFIRFFANHGLLQVADRPEWRTVRGGSRVYVNRILDEYQGETATDDPVEAITRGDQGVTLTTAAGRSDIFDQCVLACHADEALALLTNPTPAERNLLGAFAYIPNQAWLHRDVRFMPRRRHLWTSWNYLGDGNGDEVSVTYWMNKLQPLDTATDFFVTLNPWHPIHDKRVLGTFDYTHPRFDLVAMRAQKDLWSLQGRDRLWFCGSYFGYGFHEDGLQSGLAVAEDLAGRLRPWQVAGERDRILSPQARTSTPPIVVASQ